jgi:hypothetical protein
MKYGTGKRALGLGLSLWLGACSKMLPMNDGPQAVMLDPNLAATPDPLALDEGAPQGEGINEVSGRLRAVAPGARQIINVAFGSRGSCQKFTLVLRSSAELTEVRSELKDPNAKIVASEEAVVITAQGPSGRAAFVSEQPDTALEVTVQPCDGSTVPERLELVRERENERGIRLKAFTDSSRRTRVVLRTLEIK